MFASQNSVVKEVVDACGGDSSCLASKQLLRQNLLSAAGDETRRIVEEASKQPTFAIAVDGAKAPNGIDIGNVRIIYLTEDFELVNSSLGFSCGGGHSGCVLRAFPSLSVAHLSRSFRFHRIALAADLTTLLVSHKLDVCRVVATAADSAANQQFAIVVASAQRIGYVTDELVRQSRLLIFFCVCVSRLHEQERAYKIMTEARAALNSALGKQVVDLSARVEDEVRFLAVADTHTHTHIVVSFIRRSSMSMTSRTSRTTSRRAVAASRRA